MSWCAQLRCIAGAHPSAVWFADDQPQRRQPKHRLLVFTPSRTLQAPHAGRVILELRRSPQRHSTSPALRKAKVRSRLALCATRSRPCAEHLPTWRWSPAGAWEVVQPCPRFPRGSPFQVSSPTRPTPSRRCWPPRAGVLHAAGARGRGGGLWREALAAWGEGGATLCSFGGSAALAAPPPAPGALRTPKALSLRRALVGTAAGGGGERRVGGWRLVRGRDRTPGGTGDLLPLGCTAAPPTPCAQLSSSPGQLWCCDCVRVVRTAVPGPDTAPSRAPAPSQVPE